MSEASVLHVLNGDATRIPLERSRVPGICAVWADVLHEGPCRLLPPREWLAIRAHYLAQAGYGEEAALLAIGERWQAQLDRFGDFDEVVFWFEHDLFDQLLLIRHLHWRRSLPAGPQPTFSLICICEFPGVKDFVGLGQLSPAQLASLFGTRHDLTAAEIELGAAAWERFCAPQPAGLIELLSGDTSALPFLDGALRRMLADYPGASGGLSRSERQILQAVGDGVTEPVEVFLATQRMEERIFMGDTTFWRIARSLMRGAKPLVAFRHGDPNAEMDPDTPGRVLPRGALRLTETGRRVLAGEQDHVELNGIDRWIGGVHVADGRWRWNGQSIVLSP